MKHCPLCSSRRHSLQRPLSFSGVPGGSIEFSSSQQGRESSQYQGLSTEFSSSSYPSNQYLTHASHHGEPYPTYGAQHQVFSQSRQLLQQQPRPSSQQTFRQESLQTGGTSLRQYHEAGPFRHGYRRSSQSDALPVSSRSVLQSPYSNDSYPGRDWGGQSQFTDEAGPGDESDDEDDLLMDEDDDFNDPDEDSWQPSFLKHHRRDTGQSKSSGGELEDEEFTPSGMVGIPQEIRPFSGAAPRHHPHRAASFDLHAGHRPQQHQALLSSSYHLSHGQGSGPGPGSGLPSQGQELRQYPDAPLPMAHHPNGHLIHGRRPIHNRLMMGAGPEYPRYTVGSNTVAFSQPMASHHGLYGPGGTMRRSVSSGLDYGIFTRGAIDGSQVNDPPDEHPGAKDAREQVEQEGNSARMDQDEVEHEAG